MLFRKGRPWLTWLMLGLALAVALPVVACQPQAAAPKLETATPVKEAPKSAGQATATESKPAPGPTQAAKPAESKPAASAPAKRYKVRMAQIYVAGALGPFWTAKDNGIFEKHGIDLEVISMRGSALGTQALISGSAEVMLSAPSDATISARAQGQDVVILGSLSNSLEYRLIVAPSISKASDLKGKAVIISAPGGSDDRLTRIALQKLGLDPEKDVQWLNIGAHPERLATMLAGQGHATAVTPPTTLMFLQKGFKELVNLADLDIPYVATTLHANGKWVKENPEAAEAFLKAIIEGIHTYRTNKAIGKKALQKNMEVDDDATLESTYESTSAIQGRYLDTDMRGLQDQIDETVARNEKVKGLKAEAMADFSIARKIKASGFNDSLPWR